MITTKTLVLLLAATILGSTSSLFADGHGDPYRPIGSLSVLNHLVKSGTKTNVSWNIQYPVTVSDLVLAATSSSGSDSSDSDSSDSGSAGYSGTLTTKTSVRMKIRVAGVAFQSGNTKLPVAFWTSIGGGGWQQLFYGTSTQVVANEYLFDQIVPSDTTIDFAARGRTSSGSWYDTRWTRTPDSAVIGLVNGNTPPAYAPAYQQGDIESFLTGLIGFDGSGSTVTIGPRDMIYLFELASRDPGDWYFDMQDLVVVITFEPINS